MPELRRTGVSEVQKLEACDREFSTAFYRKEYARAADALRAGLSVFDAAHAEEPGLWVEADWFPGGTLLGRQAAVAAALAGAHDLLARMGEIARFVGASDAEALRGAELSRAMHLVRTHLERVRTSTLRELVEANPDIGPDPYRAVEWLAKNREVGLEGRGASLTISWGRATERPLHQPLRFREGAELVLSTPLDLSRTAPPLGVEQWRGSIHDAIAGAEPVATTGEPRTIPLRPDQRVASPSQTLSLRDVSWLVASSTRRPGVEPTTAVVIKDRHGESVRELTLDHGWNRLFEASDLEHAVLLDRAGTVFAYDADGDPVARISLASTPEYGYFASLPHYDHASSIRAVDLDVERETLAFSLANAVYRFRFDGSLVSATNLPFWPGGFGWWEGDRPYGKIPNMLERLGRSGNLTDRQAVSIFAEPARNSDRHLIAPIRTTFLALTDGGAPVEPYDARRVPALTRLWIALQFPRMDYAHRIVLSRVDDTLLVATHSGLLLQLTPGGGVLGSWLIPSHATAMRQLDDGTIVVANEAAFAMVRAGEAPTIVDGIPGRPWITSTHLVKRTDRTVTAVRLDSGAAGAVQLESAFRAAYDVEGALAVESTTRRYLLAGG